MVDITTKTGRRLRKRYIESLKVFYPIQLQLKEDGVYARIATNIILWEETCILFLIITICRVSLVMLF
jgi:hypothetical protein